MTRAATFLAASARTPKAAAGGQPPALPVDHLGAPRLTLQVGMRASNLNPPDLGARIHAATLAGDLWPPVTRRRDRAQGRVTDQRNQIPMAA